MLISSRKLSAKLCVEHRPFGISSLCTPAACTQFHKAARLSLRGQIGGESRLRQSLLVTTGITVFTGSMVPNLAKHVNEPLGSLRHSSKTLPNNIAIQSNDPSIKQDDINVQKAILVLSFQAVICEV